MGRRLPVWVLAFGLGVAMLLPAASAGPHGESTRGGTLRLMWATEPDSLDPANANGRVGSWVLLNATCAKLRASPSQPSSSHMFTTSGQRPVLPIVPHTPKQSWPRSARPIGHQFAVMCCMYFARAWPRIAMNSWM